MVTNNYLDIYSDTYIDYFDELNVADDEFIKTISHEVINGESIIKCMTKDGGQFTILFDGETVSIKTEYFKTG